MDYTKNLSDIEAGLAARTSTIAQATGEQSALQAAHDIITTGYQSDATAIAAQVTAQVGNIQNENTTLTTQIAKLTDILKTLGYNPDGSSITPPTTE